MIAHSLRPDTAMMMLGAAAAVAAEMMAAGVRIRPHARSAAGFCAGRRPNSEQRIRRSGCLRTDKPPSEDRCGQRFGLAGLFAAYLSPYTPVLRSESDCDRVPGHGLDAFERWVTRSVVADQVGQEVPAPARLQPGSSRDGNLQRRAPVRVQWRNWSSGRRRRSCRVAHASFQGVTA